MKVYVVVTHQVHDFEDLGLFAHSFAKKKDAQKYLSLFYQDEKHEVLDGMRDWKMKKEKDYYELWVDGEWSRYHSCGYIKENIVQ